MWGTHSGKAWLFNLSGTYVGFRTSQRRLMVRYGRAVLSRGFRSRRLTAATRHEFVVAKAQGRIRDVLWQRGVVWRRELERAVCEVGFDFRSTPAEERVEPAELSEAVKHLLKRKVIEQHRQTIFSTPAVFWSLTGAVERDGGQILRRKSEAVKVFMKISKGQHGCRTPCRGHTPARSSSRWR